LYKSVGGNENQGIILFANFAFFRASTDETANGLSIYTRFFAWNTGLKAVQDGITI
jgi:hypothetical protein